MALFITFEGIEGSGKTTQIKLLSKHLNSSGIKHILTREPGGTAFGNALRKLILVPKFKNLEPFTEACIMLAARCEHVKDVIKKNLDLNKHVLCDRFTDATLAYQGGGRNLDVKYLQRINALATKGIHPDLTVLFDLPAKEGLKRSLTRLKRISHKNRESRFEEESLKFHEKVRKTYLRLAKKHKKRIKVINARQDIESISIQVRKIVLNEFKKNKRSAKGR